MIVNVQKETSEHTIIKGDCVIKQRGSLFGAGPACRCSCSFCLVSPQEMQHGLPASFSSFVFQWGRQRAVTCQRCLYYFGEARGGKKKVPWVVSISVTVAVWSPQPTNIEISVFFLTAAFHVSCTASCLADSSTYCLFFEGRSRGMVKLLPTNQKGKYLILLSLQNLLPQIHTRGISEHGHLEMQPRAPSLCKSNSQPLCCFSQASCTVKVASHLFSSEEGGKMP